MAESWDRVRDRVLDYDSGGVQKDAGQIADEMSEWEGRLAESLELTIVDVAEIKTKHPRSLNLQSREALEKWRQMLGPKATYGHLFDVFQDAGYNNLADLVKRIATSKGNASVLLKCVSDYEKLLKDKYNYMVPFLESSWLTTSSRKAHYLEFTKLVIIKHDNLEGFTESETLHHDYVHGKVDSISAYKKEVELADILDPVYSSDTSRQTEAPKVLMDGAPGVGKTTLTIKACKGWAENRLFKRYELVVLVPLRQNSCRNAKSIEDFLPGDDSDLKKRVTQYITEKDGESIAFIFDGYDELSYKQRKAGSLFMEIICGRKLSKCALLVTSRPHASVELRKLSSINRHVEVLGFKIEQIHSCIRKEMNDKIKADGLISQLKERGDIVSLCYIPLLCKIMIYVYESQNKSSLPNSVTTLLEYFLLHLLRRQIDIFENDEDFDEECVSDLNDLPESLSNRLEILENLAYQCLINDKLVFSYSELKAKFGPKFNKSKINFHCLGLVTSIASIDNHVEYYFQFLHLSIQEFLAARYVSKTVHCDEQINIFLQYINKPRFRLFLLFYAGMTPLNKVSMEIVFRLLFKKCKPLVDEESLAIWSRNFLLYIHIIFESQKFDIFNALLDSLPNKSMLSFRDYKLSLFDCKLLTHFLCSIEHCWTSIDLNSCSLTVDSLCVIHQIYNQSHKRVSIDHVDLSGNDPHILLNLQLFPWLQSIKSLSFTCSESEIEPKYLQSLFSTTFDFLSHITKLDIQYHSQIGMKYNSISDLFGFCIIITPTKVSLCHSSLGSGFVDYLANIEILELKYVDLSTVQMVHPFLNSLKVLEIHNVNNLDEWISDSASIIKSSKTLKKLALCGTRLHYSSIKCLFISLANNSSIQELNISDCHGYIDDAQCDKAGKALQVMLEANKSIQQLVMRASTVNDNLAQYIITGLNKNTTLKFLDLKHGRLSFSTVCSLIEMVVNCSELSYLCVEEVKLHKTGSFWKLESISSLIPGKLLCLLRNLHQINVMCPKNLEVMLNDSTCTFECRKYFQTLQRDQLVKKILISDVRLDTEVCLAFELMLTCHTVLRKLHLFNCVITDSALKHLTSGIISNSSIKELSLTGFKNMQPGNVAAILNAISSNNSIQILNLSANGTLLVESSSDLIASGFQKLFKGQNRLTSLTLHGTHIDDSIAVGMANGLVDNTSLKSLEISFSTLSPHGAAKLLFAFQRSMVTEVEVYQLCHLRRIQCFGDWDLKVYNERFVWPHIPNICSKLFLIGRFKVSEHGMQRFFQVERTLNALIACTLLTVLDLSNQNLSCENENVSKVGEVIGRAFEMLLITCVRLEVLILKACQLPEGTWRHAAKGLCSPRCSLKYLDVSQCNLSVIEAISIFNSLKSVRKIDLSDNKGLTDTKYRDKFCCALRTALTSSSVQSIDFKNSIDDKTAERVAATLQDDNSLKTIVLNEQDLSCAVVQQFIFLLLTQQDQTGLDHLIFSDISFSRNEVYQTKADVIVKYVHSIIEVRPYMSRTTCKSSKVFSVLCSILHCHQQDIIPFSLTELELNEVSSDSAVIIFRSLSHNGILSKVTNVSIKGVKTGGNGPLLRQAVKKMLETNNTLLELTYDNVNEFVIVGLAEGLQLNSTLRFIRLDIDLKVVVDHTLAELLKAIGVNKRLLKLEIHRLPLIYRPSVNSSWCMAMSVDGYNKQHSTHYYPAHPWFICAMSRICRNPKYNVNSHVAELLLKSCPKLNMSQSDHFVDIGLLTDLFISLAFNCTVASLDLSKLEKLANCCDLKLLEAVQEMLINNKSIEELNMSYSLNVEIVSAMVSGLQKNHTLKHLHIDVTSLNVELMLKLMECFDTGNLLSLNICDLVLIQKLATFQWKLIVSDALLWSQILLKLKQALSNESLKNKLHLLPTLEHFIIETPMVFKIDFEVNTLHSCSAHEVPCERNLIDSSHTQLTEWVYPVLDLTDCVHNVEVLCSIVKSLDHSSQITEFNFSVNEHFSERDHETVANALKHMLATNHSLKHIVAYGLHDSEAEAICSGIKPGVNMKYLTIQADYLSVEVVAGLLEQVQSTTVTCVTLDPICTLESTKGAYSLKALSSHHKFIRICCRLFQMPNCSKILSSLTELDAHHADIDSTLAVSIFSFLTNDYNQVRILDISANVELNNADESVGLALQAMLETNKVLEHLIVNDSCNDSIASAIAKGLNSNQTLCTLHISILNLGDSVLVSLFASLSRGNSLEITGNQYIFGFKRVYIPSTTTGRSLRPPECYPQYIPFGRIQCRAPHLGRVMLCMSNNCEVRDLTISYAVQSFSPANTTRLGETVSNGLTSLLHITSLHSLTLCNPLSNDVMKALAVSLKENSTLKRLVIHKASLQAGDNILTHSIVSSALVTLELIGECIFSREQGTSWNLEMITYKPDIIFQGNFSIINNILKITGIEIDTVVDKKQVYELELRFPSSSKLYKIMLKSMETGSYLVEELSLVFNPDIDETCDCGIAIERMLLNVKSLKVLKIDNLRSNRLIKHVFTGLSQCTSLTKLYIYAGLYQCRFEEEVDLIKKQILDLQDKHFIHQMLTARFTENMTVEIDVAEVFTLRRKLHDESERYEKANSCFRATLQKCEHGYTPQADNSDEHRFNSMDLPDLGCWMVIPGKGVNLLSVFCMLSKYCTTSYTSIGNLALQTLTVLNFSRASLTYSELASLFEFMQNKVYVRILDVSYCIQQASKESSSNSQFYQNFQGMVEQNTSLKMLDLSGIVDDEIAAILVQSLHKCCSLLSLTFSIDTKIFNPDKIMDIMHSFIQSSLCQLCFTDFCLLYKDQGLCYIDLMMNYSSETLVQYYVSCIMILANVVSKSDLVLALDTKVKNDLFIDVFPITSTLSESYKTAGISLLTELHLEITTSSKMIMAHLINEEYFHSSTSLKRLYLSHDIESSKYQPLMSAYQNLLATNVALELISFMGLFSNIIAEGVTTGIQNSKSLQTLQFSSANLTVNVLANLLWSVHQSSVVYIDITEGCSMRRSQGKSPYNIQFTGSKWLLFMLFCASVKVFQRNGISVSSSELLSGDCLDLSCGRVTHGGYGMLVLGDNHEVFHVAKEGFISQLVLTGNTVSVDEGLFSCSSVLKVLTMDNCKLVDSDCELIARGLAINSKLKVLDLHSNEITINGATMILNSALANNTLKNLDLSSNNLLQGSNEARSLVYKLQENQALEVLYLGWCDPLCADLSTGLSNNNSLRVLSLKIKEEELLIKILNSLEQNQKVEIFDISESSVQTSAASIAVQQLLLCNKVIRTLSMHDCSISDSVCIDIVDGLAGNSSLEKLDLSNNAICAHGILSLFQILESNKCCLVELDLSANWNYQRLIKDISSDQLEITAVLLSNKTLKVLTVSNFYGFSKWFGIKLFRGLERNSTLCTLDISENVFNEQTFSAFINMLAINKGLKELNVTGVEYYAQNENLAEYLFKCTSLEKIVVDPITKDILESQEEGFSQRIAVIKSVGNNHHYYSEYDGMYHQR